MRRRIIRIILALSCVAVLLVGSALPVCAGTLDEIEKYEITADVNNDATVTLKYHIEWRVLDSDSEGPLEWVRIGLPNSHVDSIKALSDNISSLSVTNDYGTYAEIYFDREYEEDEVVKFDFEVVQGYLYQMNRDEEGYTVYTFTPGWFDDIAVDSLVIRWNANLVSSWEPDCLLKNGYNTWQTSLDDGDSFTISVTYPNDAFAFNQNVSDNYEDTDYEDWDDWDDEDWRYDDYDDGFGYMFSSVLMVVLWGIIGTLISVTRSNREYEGGANFGAKTQTKVTRTRVVYHTNCPNCGAPRKEGKDVCEFCGTNLIKSEDIIKEEDLTDEEKREMKKYRRDGEYAFPSIPDTYIRVHTVRVPIPPSSSHHHGGGRHGGGCAHSSCACACASCACACACACAGGGRAGCSNKDFYRDSLKLKQLEEKVKSRND